MSGTGKPISHGYVLGGMKLFHSAGAHIGREACEGAVICLALILSICGNECLARLPVLVLHVPRPLTSIGRGHIVGL